MVSGEDVVECSQGAKVGDAGDAVVEDTRDSEETKAGLPSEVGSSKGAVEMISETEFAVSSSENKAIVGSVKNGVVGIVAN